MWVISHIYLIDILKIRQLDSSKEYLLKACCVPSNVLSSDQLPTSQFTLYQLLYLNVNTHVDKIYNMPDSMSGMEETGWGIRRRLQGGVFLGGVLQF